MKHLMLLAFFVLIGSFPVPSDVLAQDGARRVDDQPYDEEALAALPGQSFVFYDDGEALFGDDGAYSYTYSAANGGGTAWGSYRVAQDGRVCVTFVNGMSRCDQYVTNRDRTVVITSDGQRFPVRLSHLP
ncbi:hypothetical protein [Phaeobacter inhibens]|uniref:hypothetical protein n=2 Tax=Phaeobacter inhibens TaxID=221822 RepID=UPI0021A30837|nr:hypothetical protein [Phaeobacter inhibens]UWR48730.1 hypothetical protein K4F87_15715 [Phaeobacter inhibens]UWR52606.1 hypothetical protein K4F84_15620 [Phaeobacter inhibens]UWR72110.1 hypothetical protein K4L00_15820 [Phaeobacter inhibens]UWR84067.1 hypothetical protein K4L05_15240 [Phaeobacter inhibens]UWR95796.1 hypothetical protein K4K99_15740 [Phaeobacter inhibens]